jgi:carboxymethylenebutenolidase
MSHLLRIVILIALFANAHLYAQSPKTINVPSGSLKLKAKMWQPKGTGPFPAVLFCPGSGLHPQPENLGPVFAKHGYVFFALFRSGQGLSTGQGVETSVRVEGERGSNGDDAANVLQVKLLEGEQLDQELSGLTTLRSLGIVDQKRIAVVGHSFGGMLAMLLAERDPSIRAVVNFGGGARSWPRSSYLRDRVVQAIPKITTPVFSIYAANDYSTEPGKVLDDELGRQGKRHRLTIFPAFGTSVGEGHNIIYFSVGTWEREVFEFIDEYTKR